MSTAVGSRARAIATEEAGAAQGLREFHGPHTGRGMGAHEFAWPALALELSDPGNASAGVPRSA